MENLAIRSASFRQESRLTLLRDTARKVTALEQTNQLLERRNKELYLTVQKLVVFLKRVRYQNRDA
jgi:hypothetical protein